MAGQLHGFSNITRDITGRKEAEEALRSSLKELADLKFALDESVIIAMADVKGTITYVNDKFCEVSRYSREEFLARDHRIVDPLSPREVRRWSVADYHARGSLACRRSVPGQGRHLLLARRDYRPIPRRARRPCYVAICNDITRRKQAEEALRRSLEGSQT